jgi:hypothetical protein
MTDLDANKRLAVHWLELVNDGNVAALDQLTSPTWRMYGGPPQLPPGRAGLDALFASIGPVEQTWTVDDVVGEGDRVVIRATNNCIQDSFLGVPAAGVRQIFTATFTMRIEDGLIAETWRNADDLGRLIQLGARIVPPDPGPD